MCSFSKIIIITFIFNNVSISDYRIESKINSGVEIKVKALTLYLKTSLKRCRENKSPSAGC